MTSGSRVWAAIVIVGMCILAGLALAGNAKSDGARRAALASEENTRLAQANTARTECIRGIASELDHARWALVGQAFNATSRDDAHRIGAQLNHLALITDLANHGGQILGEPIAKCPPVPTTKGNP